MVQNPPRNIERSFRFRTFFFLGGGDSGAGGAMNMVNGGYIEMCKPKQGRRASPSQVRPLLTEHVQRRPPPRTAAPARTVYKLTSTPSSIPQYVR